MNIELNSDKMYLPRFSVFISTHMERNVYFILKELFTPFLLVTPFWFHPVKTSERY